MMNLKARGFTLIELVVVITILGILAAFAIPKFVALDQQARIATVNGLAGTVKSAAALARSYSMVNSGPVVMEGVTITMLNNYPDSLGTGIPAAINGITNADFTYAAGATAPVVGTWTRVGAPTPANCTVTYLPAAANGSPAVTATTSGC
jgi:MSHA pilin protein MshA